MIAERFQQEFQKELKAKAYKPAAEPTIGWYSCAVAALKKVSPAQLGVSAIEFSELYYALSEGKQLSFMQFAIANNTLENMNAESLGLELRSYFILQEEVEKHAKNWTEASSYIRQHVQQRLNEEEKMKAAASNVPILKPIVGEA